MFLTEAELEKAKALIKQSAVIWTAIMNGSDDSSDVMQASIELNRLDAMKLTIANHEIDSCKIALFVIEETEYREEED